jgi:hypothetical protein
VLEGELTFSEQRDETMRCTRTLGAGGSLFIAPWVYHATLNLSVAVCRFEVIGQPAMMSGYFAEAGVPVIEAAAGRTPPGPADLREISSRWGIEFWTGPVDQTASHRG